MINQFHNEDCFNTMDRMIENNILVDAVITSPFYNTNKKQGKKLTLSSTKSSKTYTRYDVHVDDMTNNQYIDFTVKLFNKYNQLLSKNGVVLYNMSYGSNNTEAMPLAVAAVISQTEFTLADIIVWKKPHAVPNNMSKNKLTRMTELVYVFVRRNEFSTFSANKAVVSRRPNGQANYENVTNFIEARNNDGPNSLNKATFSSELVGELINRYLKEGQIVYDSFMGTGTTAVACVSHGLNFIGSEISEAQVEYAEKRLYKHLSNFPMVWKSSWSGEEVGHPTKDIVEKVGINVNEKVSLPAYVCGDSGEVIEVIQKEEVNEAG